VLIGILVISASDFTGKDQLQFVVGLGVLVALGYFAKRYSTWATTNFVVTSERVISRSGVVAKKGIEIPLERINTVFFNQGFFERMIGAGDLAIESAGERGTETLSDIRKPAIVQREIYVQMENNENRKFDRVRGPGPAGITTAEQLEKLHNLLQQGAISQAQFEAERAKLIGS
jgi:uncharacterized membrane protein YdbT with pleckstrin-like domain